jgi:pantoate--beta-alanine ligase
MKIISSWRRMQKIALDLKKRGKKIGFVPTMGALHLGHLSLIRKAVRKSNVVVVSIFVNPLQFGPADDFKKYPRDFKKDQALLESEKVDYLFFPSEKEIYPPDFKTAVEIKRLSQILCGRFRPGHFIGVATVVLKLFNIVQPDYAFFGEKDYQQLVIIRQLGHDLNWPVKIISGGIIRKRSGLALSSRNLYLSGGQEKKAAVLYGALLKARSLVSKGEKSSPRIIMVISQMIEEAGGRIEYVAVVDPVTLEEVRKITKPVRVLLAARIAGIRLIDNLLLIPA